MIHQSEAQQIDILYAEERLAELLETLDQLHSAASDDDLPAHTTLSQRELVAMLQEVVYTAQETIQEINKAGRHSPAARRPHARLHILEKPAPAASSRPEF